MDDVWERCRWYIEVTYMIVVMMMCARACA